ncbi:MAG: DUF3052 family protein [Flavobacteriaceae bacterium]|nr:DUF3052 family protein [Flavobacteriaceae bacterium]
MTSGYSGTPLARKLGLKPDFRYVLYNAPSNYMKWFNTLEIELQQASIEKNESADFIHVFCTDEQDLENVVRHYKSALVKNGMLWVSWPKGGSAIKTTIKRDMIRNYFLDNGLVDVKVAAIDEDWSGLKFVYRSKDRTS